MKLREVAIVVTFTAAMVSLSATPVIGQVGEGLLDLNTASTEQLTALPHMTADIVKQVEAGRPFDSIVDVNTELTGAGLSEEQIAAVYAEAFVHANLNSAVEPEFMLIPGVGHKMAHEFEEYRPWNSWAQFDREIGKYVDKAEVQRLKQYVFIPLDLNKASEEEFQSIPGVGHKMAHEFEEYRPWKSQEQFEREIGKYVGEEEVARLWRYVVIR